MKTVRRLCFAAAIALGGLSVILPAGAHGAPLGLAPPPQGAVFAGVAVASAVHQQFDAVGGFSVVQEPIYDNVPDALTEFNGDKPLARAATYYPGGTFANFFPFACGQVYAFPIVCTPPIGYPLIAQAPTLSGGTDSATPATQQVGAGPVNVTAVSATAHADHTYTDARATDGAFSSGGASTNTAGAVLAFRRAVAAALHGPVAAAAVQPEAADNSTASSTTESATSHQSWNSQGQLVVTSTATDHGVSMLGGAIKISSVVVTSTYVNDGAKVKQHTQNVTVSGVTAGGMPATIDQNGITVNGIGTGKPAIDAVNSALQQLLSATSTNVRLLTPSNSSKPGQVPAGLDSPAYGAFCSSGEADGVQMYQQLDATKVPAGQDFYSSTTFGSACTDASVLLGSPSSPPISAPPVSTPPLPGLAAGPSAPLAAPGSTGSQESSLPATQGNVTSAPGAVEPPAVARSGGSVIGRLEDDLAGVRGRVSLLYLAFVIAFVGLALGVLPFLRPRLPGTR